MFSTIDRSIVYPIGTDITEHDINIVSDLWTMAGRQVYRGARDPNYTHANVYWLYDPDDLDRVGVSEHKLDNPVDVSLLWHRKTAFGTLLQEDDWVEGDTIWGELGTNAYEQFLAEGWTTPRAFLERCLRSSLRIVVPDMLVNPLSVYSCEKCKRISLTPFACSVESPMTFPSKEKVFFVDDRMVVYSPPKDGSLVWSLLGFTEPQSPSAASSEPLEPPVLAQVLMEESERAASPPHSSPPPPQETHPQPESPASPAHHPPAP